MKIRRFFGTNIRSALRQVTDEFGNDAAILSNKRVAGGVEVIAAIDYDESLVPPSLDSRTIEPATGKPELSNGQTSDARIDYKGLENSENIELERKTISDLVNEEKDEQVNLSTSVGLESTTEEENLAARASELLVDQSDQKVVTPINAKERVEWTLDPSLQAMKEELGMMRTMMSEQLKGIGWHRFTQDSPLSAMILRRLAKLGLDNEYLNSLMPHVTKQSDPECAWQQILAILAKSIPISGCDLLEKGGIYAFVGNSGVGKTTTIAKLAARYVIKHGADSVAMITTDNYRISAQEQLVTFGRLLQIETARVSDKQSLDSLLTKFADKSLILIDTAGMNRGDSHLFTQLENLQHASQCVKKLLVLSATNQGAVTQESINFFGAYEPCGVVVTKLDEAASLGELLSVVTKVGTPIVYTTDGQRIPEDVRIARSHHLVSKAVWLANKYTKNPDDWALAQSIEQAQSA